MKKNSIICFLLVLLVSSCSLMKQYRYMSNAKAPKGTFRTEIPFEIRNGLIVIKAKLNDSDKEIEFVLDTGAPVSVIYQEVLQHAKKVMTYKVSDSQGNSPQSDYIVLDVKLGNVVFKDVFAAYPAAAGEYLSCTASGGLIGADLMQTANWQIDFANKKIVISDRKKSSLPDLNEYQKVSFSKRSPSASMPWLTVLPGMTVDLNVNGTLLKDVYVDLGSNGALTLPKNAVTAKAFKNDQKLVMTGIASFGLFGASAKTDTTFFYRSSATYMDKINFNAHTIVVSTQNNWLLGTEIFSDYTMFIDFRKRDLYLKPVTRETKQEDEKKFGFYLNYDSKNKSCYVSGLFEGASAVKAGLQLKDTIVEINHEKLPVFKDYCEFRIWHQGLQLQKVLMLKTHRSDDVIKIEKAVIPKS